MYYSKLVKMRKSDYYSRLAKQKGFQARSVFKLEEIQKKFRLINKNQKVLDIGASPGSWSLYVLTKLQGTVVGVDLQDVRMPPSVPFVFIKGDIYKETVLEKILNNGPYNTVMSDAAPATSGNRFVDTTRSHQLGERVLEIACLCLKDKGNIAIKVFQGGDEKILLEHIKIKFLKARAFKPDACRKKSFETYLLGFGYKKK